MPGISVRTSQVDIGTPIRLSSTPIVHPRKRGLLPPVRVTETLKVAVESECKRRNLKYADFVREAISDKLQRPAAR